MPISSKPLILQCRQHTLHLITPKIMGIINVNLQSFSNKGRITNVSEAIDYAKMLIAEGADIIDIGAEPANPWVKQIPSIDEEIKSLVPVITELVKSTTAIISVDTSQPKVMQAVIKAGAHMINDIRALTVLGALDVVANSNVAVCLMHHLPMKNDKLSISQINQDLQACVDACLQAGITPERICIDPGFGGGSETFHKPQTQSIELLSELDKINVQPERPMLVGVSRKGFLSKWNPLQIDVMDEQQIVAAGITAAKLAIAAGAKIIRTHDVAVTRLMLR